MNYENIEMKNNIVLGNASNALDYVNLQEFVQKVIPENKEKAFAPLTSYKAFKEFLNNKGENLKAGLLDFKKKQHIDGIKESLKKLEKATSFYREVPTESSFNESTKMGKKALGEFIYHAASIGVKSETIMQSFVVLGSIAGYDIDLKDVRKADFRISKNDEDFLKTAYAISNISVSLKMANIEEEEKTKDQLLEEAANEGHHVSRKVDITFDEVDLESASKYIKQTLNEESSSPYRTERLKKSINKMNNR